MPFDWKEYLGLSRFLATEPGIAFSEEAAFRSAVSRAYYAAFCHARNYARDRQGLTPKYDVNDHRLVRDHFRARPGGTGIASSLSRLRQWRNDCDYCDTVSSLPDMVKAAIGQAQHVLSKLS